MSNLRWINLNLLPVLREVLRHRNITRASEALNMSQSAVSESMRRLRELSGDELLTPQGRMLVKTAFAERVAPELEDALATIDRLFARVSFDPAKTDGIMRVGTADYVWLVLAKHALPAIFSQAPKLRVSAIPTTVGSVAQLQSGMLDFIIAPSVASPIPWDEVQAEFLFDDEQVCVVSNDAHISSPMTVAEFEALPHVSYHPNGGDDIVSTSDGIALRQAGLTRRSVITVPNFFLLPIVAAAIGGVAICPRMLAEPISGLANVRIVKPPTPFPPLRIMIISANLSQSDPAKRWFQEQLIEHCRGLREN